ncbi:hypothetical protein [Vacuolonema iberomarrocanum]|uniref:hypothetical protein n=1 Tax=Vacuolonema iberomarrocanum TaxID=3454632 RepID=UPI001A0F494C|nr:tetratricopeptide repeat protein [filamentous cyanobacterium LEGE 07170]
MRFIHLLSGVVILGSVGLPFDVQAQNTASPNSTLEEAVVLTYNDYMSLGYNAEQEGRYYEATQYFRYALYLNPQDRAAITAYWNARDALSNNRETPVPFDVYMNRGYDATEAREYQAALEYFQQALSLRLGNYYATQAIRNVQTYLNSDELAMNAVDPVALSTSSADEVAVGSQEYLGEAPYDRYMRLGYAALQEELFTTAAGYFRSALYERPDDRWATIAYWNAVDGARDGEAGLGSEEVAESRYDQLMRLGYDATQRGNYETALEFFQQALNERPEDYYATEAIENVSIYLMN